MQKKGEINGYYINDETFVEATSDRLYVPSDYNYYLVSPSVGYFDDEYDYVGNAGLGRVSKSSCFNSNGVRPVVCLKSSIPATVGTGDYDFELVK